MKIEWLDASLTEALVTRGILWWKRVARVRDVGTSFRFVPSDEDVGSSLAYVLRIAKERECGRRIVAHRERNWRKAHELPAARALTRRR